MALSNAFSIDNSSELNLELTVAQAVCEVIDTPRALTVYLLVKYEQWNQLVDLVINPDDYKDARNFADDYLVTEILSKSQCLPLGVDRSQVAVDDFWSSERRCRSTNDRLLDASIPEPEQLVHVRRKIAKALGPLTRKDLDFIESNFRFGPGATTAVPGRGCVLSDKYDAEMHLSRDLVPFYKGMLGERWWDSKKCPVIVPGNKFTTVPKNAKKDRGICIEPTLNIYGQLGIGALLRRRLGRLGIDISTQLRNQDLASVAYEENLATIDLSAASDSLSWFCVEMLLPPEWLELLNLFRCTHTMMDGSPVELEKFSSMGNGFTFELETLIFSAVAFSCVDLLEHHHVSVYGDDIIVPQSAANDVIDVLGFLGFQVNDKKSFLAGSFFESCGTDWFLGRNVRPFFLRSDPKKKAIPYADRKSVV